MIKQRTPIAPMPPAPFHLSQGHFIALAIVYGLMVLYSSLMLGPDGLHYVPLSAAEAWQRFRMVHFVDNASDQRADWIANAIMTIPLAYFLNGAFAGSARGSAGAARAVIALLVCIIFILAAKYAQLFFPPRTVTLNYIVAQSLGAMLGVAAFRFAYRRLFPTLRVMYRNGDGLVIVLGAYSLLLAAFILMPFDLALSPSDLAARFANLPLSVAPDDGRRLAYRAVLVIADAAAMAPLGMFLAVSERERSFRALLWQGVGLVSALSVVSLFVLSASPFLLSLISRPVGVAAGIGFIIWVKGKDLWKRRYRYARYVPIAFPLYILLLIWGNGLLSGGWWTLDQAADALEPRRLLPLWSFYIVAKVQAAQTVVTALCVFAPIGAMIWLRRGFWVKGAGFSAFAAFVLSLSIEIARSLKPGLTPEFNEPLIAAAGAALTFRAMPALWRIFAQEAKTSIVRDSYASKVARVAHLFGGIELLPRSRRLDRIAASHAGRLAAAQQRITELEDTVRKQERELENLRQSASRSKSSAA